MSTIITSTLLILFVLVFIILIVISGRIRRDYEDKLHMMEQQEKETYSYSADVIKEQENSHTINISSEKLSNNIDDVSIANFKIK